MRVIADPINNTVNLITAICYNNGLPKNIIWECFIFPHIWGGDAISRRSPDTVNLINSSSVVRIVFRIPFFLLLSFFFSPRLVWKRDLRRRRLTRRLFWRQRVQNGGETRTAGRDRLSDAAWRFSTLSPLPVFLISKHSNDGGGGVKSRFFRRWLAARKKKKKNFHKWRSNIWNESLISHYLWGCGDNWGKFLRESAPTTTFPVTIRDDRRDKETSKFWGMFPSSLGCFLTAVSKRLKTLWYRKGQRRLSRDSNLTPQ